MKNKNNNTEAVYALWALSLIICCILDYNLIVALTLKGWNWVYEQWLVNYSFIMLPIFIFFHILLIKGFIKMK